MIRFHTEFQDRTLSDVSVTFTPKILTTAVLAFFILEN